MQDNFRAAFDKPFARYAIAVAAVTVSFLLRFVMVVRFGLELPPFITIYPAVMFVAIVGGLGPGLVATALASVGIDYFVLPPTGSFAIAKTSDAVALAFFAVMGVLMSLLAEHYRRILRSTADYKAALVLRQGQEQLQHASEISQLALQAAGLGIWEFLPETGKVSVDETCLKLLGIRPGEAYTNASLSERIHPEDRSIVSDSVIKSISGADEGVWGNEYRVVWPDGSIHWLTSHGRSYFTGEGKSRKAVRLIGVNMDVTDRKVSEEAEREREAQFRTLANSIPQLCWMANPDGWIFWYNQRWYEFTGTTPEQMEGWGWQSVHDPDALPIVLEQWKNCIATGKSFEMTFPLRGSDGVFRSFLSRGIPVLDCDGAVVRWFGTNTDITERKRAEDALRKSEALYHSLFNSMEEGFCVIEMLFDAEGKAVDYRFLEVNIAFEKQTGIPDAVGKRMREIAPALEDHWFEALGKIALTGEPAHFANRAKPLNSHFEIHAYRVGEPDQRHVAVVFSEISDRMRAEEHIRRLNRVYAVLSDINQTIVREKDSQAILEAACQIAVDKGKFLMAWIGMVDATRHELMQTASSGVVEGYLDQVKIDVLDPSNAAGPAARCFHSGEHSICNDIEHEFYRPWKAEGLRNGYRSMAALPLRCDGQIVGIFSLYARELGFFDEDEMKLLDEMAMDISFALEVNLHEEDRRKAEEELHWRTAFFEAQVDSALDGVVVVDSYGKKILQNKRLDELLKLPEDVSEDSDFSRQVRFVAIAVKNPDAYVERVNFLSSHPGEVSLDEVEMIDGTVLERYSAPVIDRAMNNYGRIWTFHDITERRQLEEQFRQAQKMEAIGQLTGGIAHDFNNLLTVILGCSEVMGVEVSDNPRLSKMAGMISGAAKRGADLTHRMLAFGRRQALQPKPVNINKLLAEMESFLRRTLTAEIAFNLIHGRVDSEATVDPTQLESTLLNLCVNARDAMPAGGRLTIETGYATLDTTYANDNPDVTPGEYILIAVSDTGTGISPENLRRVFDPFFTTKEVGKGTGLGLSMVYGFVKQSKGHVKIYSEPGLGTSVKLYLPLSKQKGEPAPRQQTSFASLRGSEVILLVEDNDPVRELARTQMADLGYQVLVAANGSDALEIIQAHPNIDLLFTDMAMPGGMNGRELAQKARELRPTMKVMICSGYADNAIFHEGLTGNEATVLNKPYTRLELAKTVRKVLTERAQAIRGERLNAG